MAYGLRIKDASGNVFLNTADIAARIRYSNVVAADADGSTVLADTSGKTTVCISIPLEVGRIAHAVGFTGTTFSWTAQSDPPLSSSDSLVLVLLLD